jgi:ferredoxin
MSEVIINFDSMGLEGVVAAGSYLHDAAKRLGVKIEGDCHDPETGHECVMRVGKGRNLLSPPTQTELELLSSQARRNGERLACQTIIEKPGELTIMSVKKKQEEPKVDPKSEGYKKEFEELPLEKKIAALVELEAIALGETFSYVLNSPYNAVGKVMEKMAEFGFKLERADQEAKRPDEHKKEDAKKSARKKPAAKKPAPKKTAAKKTASKRRASTKRTAKKPAPNAAGDKKEEKTDE